MEKLKGCSSVSIGNSIKRRWTKIEEKIIDLWKKGYSVDRITKVLLVGHEVPTTAQFEKSKRFEEFQNKVEKTILEFYKR